MLHALGPERLQVHNQGAKQHSVSICHHREDMHRASWRGHSMAEESDTFMVLGTTVLASGEGRRENISHSLDNACLTPY